MITYQSKCDCCGTTDRESDSKGLVPFYNQDFYWHGDIQEDYDMGDYECLCPECFAINASIALEE